MKNYIVKILADAKQESGVTYAYTPFVSNGLGTSYSSLTLGQKILRSPTRKYGRSGVEVYANIGNGNLFVVDHLVEAEESGRPFTLGYVYNSSVVGSPWHFTVKNIKPGCKNKDKTVTIIEEDGHVTVYTYDEVLGLYKSPTNGASNTTLKYNETSKLWQWYDPKTCRKELYQSNGNLQQVIDEKGQETLYEYEYVNNAYRISKITGPSGCKYKIKYQETNSSLTVVISKKETDEYTLQTHVFDKTTYSMTTTIGASYTVKYTCLADAKGMYLLNKIKQTDGTKMVFGYTLLTSREN